MSCKKTVCQECATQWEGINYCIHCLRLRREKTKTPSSVPTATFVVMATALLYFMASYLMMWLGANWARYF